MVKSKHRGIILDVIEETLESSLGTPEKVKAFLDASWKNLPDNIKALPKDEQTLYKKDRLERQGITFVVEVVGEKDSKNEPLTFKQHETIPKTTGYRKSNLKGIMERNALPPDTNSWKGKDIGLVVNEDGYWRIEN